MKDSQEDLTNSHVMTTREETVKNGSMLLMLPFEIKNMIYKQVRLQDACETCTARPLTWMRKLIEDERSYRKQIFVDCRWSARTLGSMSCQFCGRL